MPAKRAASGTAREQAAVPAMHTVAGVDVGGNRKQCDLVILRGTSILYRAEQVAPEALLQLCLDHEVVAVGVDSPSRWWAGDGHRPAERALVSERISLFSTPTRERALANTTGFYDWMFTGERVYRALSDAYPLLSVPHYAGGRVCFETYPHAITCALLGKDVASAKQKGVQRKQLLASLGVDIRTLTTVDARDAALCALTAQFVLDGRASAYGDAEGDSSACRW